MPPTSSLTYEQFLEAVRILAQPTWTDIAGVLVAGLVGIGQCLLIAWGIKDHEGRQRQPRRQLESLGNPGESLGDPRKSLGDSGGKP